MILKVPFSFGALLKSPNFGYMPLLAENDRTASTASVVSGARSTRRAELLAMHRESKDEENRI